MPKGNHAKLAYALSFAAQLGFLVVAPLVGFIWLGVYLDIYFKTAPAMLLLGLTIALTITGYETYHLLKPLLDSDKKGLPPIPPPPEEPAENPMRPPKVPWI